MAMIDLESMTQHVADASGLMRSLSNPSRLMVLCLLLEEEKSVSELMEDVPLSQSALSQQLAKLREQNLVVTRRDGQVIFYQLADDKVRRVVELLHDIYCG